MPKLKKITTNSTPAEKEKLVFDLIHWLDKRDLFMDIHIYANHKCWSSDYYDKTLKNNMSAIEDPKIAKDKFYVTDNVTAKDYIEYANEDLITMSFEGPLYHEINYSDGKTYNDLKTFFEKRGLYFELGYAWSLSTYEL